MIFAVSSLLPLKVMLTCNNFPSVFVFVANNMFYSGCLKFPLIVANDTERCHQTAVAVSPGHPLKLLLLMAVFYADVDSENKPKTFCCIDKCMKLAMDLIFLDFLFFRKFGKISLFLDFVVVGKSRRVSLLLYYCVIWESKQIYCQLVSWE